MTEGNRMFAEMMRPAREWLAGRNPQDIAGKAGVRFDGNAFFLSCMNQPLHIRWPELEFAEETEAWLQLVTLHYLARADGAPPEGRCIPFAAMKDGMVRGGGFDRQCEMLLSRYLAGKTEKALLSACIALNGKIIASNADLCAVFSFLPRFPLTLKLWFGDEDFPGSGRLFLDGSADHYLSIEDAVTVGDIFLQALMESGVEK